MGAELETVLGGMQLDPTSAATLSSEQQQAAQQHGTHDAEVSMTDNAIMLTGGRRTRWPMRCTAVHNSLLTW